MAVPGAHRPPPPPPHARNPFQKPQSPALALTNAYRPSLYRNTPYKGNRIRGEFTLQQGFTATGLQKIIYINIEDTRKKVLFSPEFCEFHNVCRECLKFNRGSEAAVHNICSCPAKHIPNAASASRTVKRNLMTESYHADVKRARDAQHQPDPFA